MDPDPSRSAHPDDPADADALRRAIRELLAPRLDAVASDLLAAADPPGATKPHTNHPPDESRSRPPRPPRPR